MVTLSKGLPTLTFHSEKYQNDKSKMRIQLLKNVSLIKFNRCEISKTAKLQSDPCRDPVFLFLLLFLRQT